jgi:hypothetical protein
LTKIHDRPHSIFHSSTLWSKIRQSPFLGRCYWQSVPRELTCPTNRL